MLLLYIMHRPVKRALSPHLLLIALGGALSGTRLKTGLIAGIPD